MTLLNFDTPLDTAGVVRRVKPVTRVTVTETVTVVPRLSQARGFVTREDAEWSWSDLRDYVVTQIEQRFGAFPRDARKESGIFKSFLARHGDKAAAIARYAFEENDGMWGGSPISVNRFCKGSDPYFAEPIAARLVDSPVADW